VKYLERQIEREVNAEKAKLSGAGQNVVHVMSVHKSKGLEYPIVILCNTGKKFNMMDSRSPVLVHGRLGLGPDVCKVGEGYRYPSILKECIKYETKRENLSEEMRILYVALTRAKERLILFGTGKSVEDRISGYSLALDGKMVPGYMVLKGESFMDWILMYLAARPEMKKGSRIHGVLLREAATSNVIVVEDENRTEDDYNSDRNDQTEQEHGDGPGAGILPEVDERLGYRYPHLEDVRRPGKISVTGLKRLHGQLFEDMEVQRPEDAEEEILFEDLRGKRLLLEDRIWRNISEPNRVS